MSTGNPSYHGYRYPREVISHAVRLNFRFSLSFRDVEDLLAERGIVVSYATIRQWRRMFGGVSPKPRKFRHLCKSTGYAMRIPASMASKSMGFWLSRNT